MLRRTVGARPQFRPTSESGYSGISSRSPLAHLLPCGRMGMFTFSHLLALHHAEASVAPSPISTPAGRGRPKVITETIERRFVEHIDRIKPAIDERRVKWECRYRESCGDADAIRYLSLKMYRERLEREGCIPQEAAQLAEELRHTPGFERRTRSNAIRLSRVRRRNSER